MINPDKNNQNINENEDEVSAANSDAHQRQKSSDDGFKTGNKSHGLTWENPMDEQAFDDESLSRNPADEEAD